MVSFTVQKFLSLIRSHLLIFAFISFILGDRSKKKNSGIYVKGLSVYATGYILSIFLSHVSFLWKDLISTGTSNPALSSPAGNESPLDTVVLVTLLSFEHRIPLLLPSNYLFNCLNFLWFLVHCFHLRVSHLVLVTLDVSPPPAPGCPSPRLPSLLQSYPRLRYLLP